ncbi:hypothetical protein BDP27DRAFT_1368208 [Rhodocollybia butyracea]|uniref:Uncharacterized protein n=1 Tax=Rhodocollybia butyracea TaxID=206335 RepID=A0A9P5U297_9AGAR|nr:hypothetical protein BDP27DRAFT_1368208 [Rhodocollybia butyracea]
MIVHFKDMKWTGVEVKNYIILERWDSDLLQCTCSLEKLEVHELADERLEPFGHTLLATLTPPPPSSTKLVFLTTRVSMEIPVYNTLESEYFYFGRAMWEVMWLEMRVPLEAVSTVRSQKLEGY